MNKPASTKVTLIAFRHGQTDWNLQQKFQGHSDIPLNDTGRSQALELSRALSSERLDVILSSDLSRAIETASIVNTFHQAPLLTSHNLRECNLGDLEGMIVADVLKVIGEERYNAWFTPAAPETDLSFPGGESKTDMMKRLKSHLKAHIVANPHHQNLGISTHAGVVRELLFHSTNGPTGRTVVKNCGIYRFDYDVFEDALVWLNREEHIGS